MPRRNVTFADKTVLLGNIKYHQPNTSHRQLAEITGVPKFIIASLSALSELVWTVYQVCPVLKKCMYYI
jgi:hypothetical protein